MMVAYRGLLAKGHTFQVKGTCLDLSCAKPRAPQCGRCFATFAVSRVHALSRARAEGTCRPVAVVALPPPTCRQGLWPQRECCLGSGILHGSHLLSHFCGLLWCSRCAAGMAVTSRILPGLQRGVDPLPGGPL